MISCIVYPEKNCGGADFECVCSDRAPWRRQEKKKSLSDVSVDSGGE